MQQAAAAQGGMHGSLAEDSVVVMGITQHLSVTPGSLHMQRRLTDGPLLEQSGVEYFASSRLCQLQEDIGQLRESQERLRMTLERMKKDMQQGQAVGEHEQATTQQDQRRYEQALEALAARLSAVEAASVSRPQHVHLHIDSDVPAPVTLALVDSAQAASAQPGTGTQLVLMTTGAGNPGAGMVTLSVRRASH